MFVLNLFTVYFQDELEDVEDEDNMADPKPWRRRRRRRWLRIRGRRIFRTIRNVHRGYQYWKYIGGKK